MHTSNTTNYASYPIVVDLLWNYNVVTTSSKCTLYDTRNTTWWYPLSALVYHKCVSRYTGATKCFLLPWHSVCSFVISGCRVWGSQTLYDSWSPQLSSRWAPKRRALFGSGVFLLCGSHLASNFRPHMLWLHTMWGMEHFSFRLAASTSFAYLGIQPAHPGCGRTFGTCKYGKLTLSLALWLLNSHTAFVYGTVWPAYTNTPPIGTTVVIKSQSR